MQKNSLEKFIPESMAMLYEQEGKGEDATVYLKVEALNGWIWYLTEFNKKDLFFGFVQGWANEWGYVSLEEINNLYKDNLLWVCENFEPISLKQAIMGCR